MSDLNDEEKKLLLDHDYDGIQEFDYPLPSWWVATFWGGIIFSVIYFIYFQLGSGPNLQDEYKEAVEVHKQVKMKYLKSLMNFNSEKYNSYIATPEMLEVGKSVFDANCASCHNQNGAGDIGPNLSDDYWLLAEGTPETVFPVVITGNPASGMPAWGQYLQEDEIYAVTSYIMSLKGFKHTIQAKGPQGDKYPADEE